MFPCPYTRSLWSSHSVLIHVTSAEQELSPVTKLAKQRSFKLTPGSCHPTPCGPLTRSCLNVRLSYCFYFKFYKYMVAFQWCLRYRSSLQTGFCFSLPLLTFIIIDFDLKIPFQFTSTLFTAYQSILMRFIVLRMFENAVDSEDLTSHCHQSPS